MALACPAFIRSPPAASPPPQVTRSGRLTKLAFNQKHPVLLVGDSKGNVTCLKLSPNLRKRGGGGGGGGGGAAAAAAAAAGGAAGKAKFEAGEQQRLDAVLEVAMKGRAGGGAAAAATGAAAAAGGARGGHAA